MFRSFSFVNCFLFLLLAPVGNLIHVLFQISNTFTDFLWFYHKEIIECINQEPLWHQKNDGI